MGLGVYVDSLTLPSVTTLARNEVATTIPQLFFAFNTVMASKPITSPIPVTLYPTLSVFMVAVGLVITASFFIYEATSTRRNRSLTKELITGAVASVFLGFGSLFLLLACGVYV